MSTIRSQSSFSRSPARASLEETMFAAPALSSRPSSAFLEPDLVAEPQIPRQQSPPKPTVERKEKGQKGQGQQGGFNPKENQPPSGGDPEKKTSKQMTKAERRAVQEAQRAAKAALKATGTQGGKGGNKQHQPGNKASESTSNTSLNSISSPPSNPRNLPPKPFDDPKKKSKAGKSAAQTLAQKPVPLLSHLRQIEKVNMEELQGHHGSVHPAVINLAIQFSEFIITGGSARCLAMLDAFKKVISDYVTPPGNSLQRHLTSHIGKQIDYLTSARCLADSMKTAIRHLKSEISNISIDKADEDAKDYLKNWIDEFIREKITVAASAIVENAMGKIRNGDVILTYGHSSVVEKLLLEAHERDIKFRVIVCDTRPKFEGKVTLRNLAQAGIQCTYILTNSLGVVMSEVTKLVIGASALLSNGAVMSRAGTAVVAMMAHDANIPVILLCELYKFSEVVRLDSFVWNEIGDPDELVKLTCQPPTSNLPSILAPPTSSPESRSPILKDWRDISDLKLLNLHYDITPAAFITLVICENGCMPSTSVLSVLGNLERERKCEATTFAISDVRTLILLLQSPESSICVAAIEAITKFAEGSSRHRTQILNLGLLKSLLALTSSKDAAIKKASVACIAASTELAELHPEMRKKELIDTLISLLSPEEVPEVQDEAAFALANLAKDFGNKADIRKAGGMKALVRLLDSQDPDVKKNVAYALSTILEDFNNRSEIRYVNGLAPLLELLGSEFTEVQENSLIGLIHSAEDAANRVEIRRLNGVKRLVDLLGQDAPELHHLTLACLANCLEDPETSMAFPEMGGIPAVIKMLGDSDVRAKRNASLALARAGRTDRNQNYIREGGALQILAANLNSADAGTASHAAMALASLAKNEINQLELNKMGVVETLIKLLGHEDQDVIRQSVLALSSLCLNEIAHNRSDIVKHGGITGLLLALSKADNKIQASAALALARCMQDAEARIALSKEKKYDGITRLISLLGAKEVNVARNAAYAISNASLYEANALYAVQQCAIESLIALGKDPVKNSAKFSTDALDKLLNQHLSAKYWLRNEISPDNIIKDGFFDIGFAGTNPDKIKGLPSLDSLKSLPVDKRREIILIDSESDPRFQYIIQTVSQNLPQLSRRQQVRQIATAVSNLMGGPIDPLKLSEFPFKFRTTELKIRLNSNVLPISQIEQGTFYHRALLFKALCDKLGFGPCGLVRGEYNRAWNIVDLRKCVLTPTTATTSSGARSAAGSASKRPVSARMVPSREPSVALPNSAAAAFGGAPGTAGSIVAGVGSAGGIAAGGLAGAGTATSVAQPPPTVVNLGAPALPPGWEPADEPDVNLPEEPTIIDLMFEPGRLLPLSSVEAMGEIGALSKTPPRLITTFKTVPPGTNGGITLLGTLASTAGGTLVGLVAGILLPQGPSCFSYIRMLRFTLLGASAGLVGSLVDSLLGATLQKTVYNLEKKQIILEGRGLKSGEKAGDLKVVSGFAVLDNHQVNFVSSLITTATTGAIVYIYGSALGLS
ncbi:Eukaryotic translation initiation factor 2B, subunit 4 delta, 67kDa [Chytridiales sp. JEL 0842]|nr:Eukaryotic translation initiation factor 2B, subunit 4 delta, 67kDa [Chytridiales sp. JEL 0842]